jgi:hypothetical protein
MVTALPTFPAILLVTAVITPVARPAVTAPIIVPAATANNKWGQVHFKSKALYLR